MILDEIVEDKKKRLPGHMARIPETEMRRMAEETKTREADCFIIIKEIRDFDYR